MPTVLDRESPGATGPAAPGPSPRRWLSRPVSEVIVAAAILLLAVVTRTLNLTEFGGDLDEGVHAMQLALMRAGYRPFQEIYASQGPLLLDLLYPLYLLFGGTLTAARLAAATYSLLGVVGVYWIGRQLGGPLWAAAAALLLVFNSGYLRGSRQVLAEAVALGPAVLAVGAALRYGRAGDRRWLLASALLFAASILVKPITLTAILPIGLIILLRGRGALRDLFVFAAVAAGLVAVISLLVGIEGIAEQILEYRQRAREDQNWRLGDNLMVIRGALGRDQLALFGLAIGGAVLLLARSPRLGLPLVAWGLAATGLLLVYSPLFPKHAATLVPPAAILAGAGLGLGRLVWRRGTRWRVASMGLVALPLAWYLATLPFVLATDLRLLHLAQREEQPRFSDSADAIRSIKALTEPNDFILTDFPSLALLAQRLVPPPLADPSKTRVRARELTGAEIAAAATVYPSPVAALWSNRFRPLRGFRAWFDPRYQVAKIYGKKGGSSRYLFIRRDADLARARLALAGDLDRRTEADFGGALRLGGYRLELASLPPGGSTGLSLEWEALTRLTTDYHVILKLVGQDGRVWDDEELSLFETEAAADWQPGRWVIQVSTIAPPADVPAGQYQVVVGVYDSERRRAVPLTSRASPPDQEIELATLEVR